MASAGATLFADLPGFVDSSTVPADHAVQMQATGNVSANTDVTGVLRIAWLIIILSLVGLWLLGRTFR